MCVPLILENKTLDYIRGENVLEHEIYFKGKEVQQCRR